MSAEAPAQFTLVGYFPKLVLPPQDSSWMAGGPYYLFEVWRRGPDADRRERAVA